MMKKIILCLAILFAFVYTFFNSIAQAIAIEAPHWQKSPISVYIPTDDAKSITMKHAFERWQRDSFGKLKFSFVSKTPADIEVAFTEKVDGSDGPIGAYNLTIRGEEIRKAEIQIATKSPNIKKYSKDYIFTVMLHEVGHALGLEDSNRKASSIMYMPVSETQDILKLDMRKLYKVNNWTWMDRRINISE